MNLELSEELRRIRGIRGLSLRKVEKQTGISNTYLSQLETGKAERPSPHILHKLAAVYDVPYESLMQAAGYLEKPSQKKSSVSALRGVLLGGNIEEEKEEENNDAGVRSKKKRLTGLQAALLSANLDEEEEKKVVEFIEFLRSQHRRRKQ